MSDLSHSSEGELETQVQTTTRTGPKTPGWATRPFQLFLDGIKVEHEVLQLCITSITKVTKFPSVMDAIHSALNTPETERDTTATEKMAKLAQRELDSDFKLLHAQATVSLWGSLETLIMDVVAAWIANRPELLRSRGWEKLRIKVGEYEELAPEDRATYLVALMDQSLGAPLKQGVSRFDALLQTIGLSVSINDDVRKALFELQQVRNLLVHRRGIVDKRFCEACPWLDLKQRQEVRVDRATFKRYSDSVQIYITEMIWKTGEAFGVQRTDTVRVSGPGVEAGP